MVMMPGLTELGSLFLRLVLVVIVTVLWCCGVVVSLKDWCGLFDFRRRRITFILFYSESQKVNSNGILALFLACITRSTKSEENNTSELIFNCSL